MHLGTCDRVFYTRSNGVRVPATVVGTAEDGIIHSEYYQDALRVVNRQCKKESISFAIPSSFSLPPIPTKCRPKRPKSFISLPATQHGVQSQAKCPRSYMGIDACSAEEFVAIFSSKDIDRAAKGVQ